MELWFYILLPLVAFMYAAVGHGGASGYLALMALFGISTIVMKPTALILNLFVAGISFYQFYRKGFFKWRMFYPFVITSIPASFIGGYLSVSSEIYKQILGVLLLFAVMRMLGLFGTPNSKSSELKLWVGLLFGGLIGFFSGLIGIGGGIILSPILLLFGWASVKETAAISALFIWVNSLSGLLGLMTSGVELHSHYLILIALALVGGLTGAYFGSSVLQNKSLSRFLSLVLLLAAIKLIAT
ncbi:MAG: sulfite exporter TauE/SafE family protein [Flavobacteriales bacterium]|nr:sulfite exporter TauE/SafE family protein [Flavobacteriales bacterium]